MGPALPQSLLLRADEVVQSMPSFIKITVPDYHEAKSRSEGEGPAAPSFQGEPDDAFGTSKRWKPELTGS
jgi:hypothetical protein